MNDTGCATIYLDTQRTIGEVSPLLFGGFAEHLGRCIYGGIYDPDSSLADENGFRSDVLAALREMQLGIIRYPGGNFVSGYDWRDGVGPLRNRPRRRELAWQSIESNQFGTDEFMRFCQTLQAEPMLAVNLGTGSIESAAAYVQYCNGSAGTEFADLRAKNGNRKPFGVKYWCLGNEMDGPWQIGALSAADYARKAHATATMMRSQDPSIKTILAGSSNPQMPTFPEWDRVILEACWEQCDYLSLHNYATNWENDTPSFLGYAAELEAQVATLAGLLRYVKSKLRSHHEVYLSWDEWNVWYKDREGDGKWREAPPLCEEIYNLEDALVVAQWLSVLLRHCDVIKIACIAQIVNVIAPLQTRGEQLLKQATFFPFVAFAKHARGVSLDALVRSPRYETKRFGEVALLDVSATHDPASGEGAIFLVNRSIDQTLPIEIAWQGAAPTRITVYEQLTGLDPKATNTFECADVVLPRHRPVPQIIDSRMAIKLPPLSFSLLKTS